MSTTRAFDHGAAHYDLMVALNPGYHRELRRAAAALLDRVGRRRGLRLVDLACGSGASTRALVDSSPLDTEVLGLDASAGMLEQARRKPWLDGVSFQQAVATELDLDGLGRGSRDGILTAYLFRNVAAAGRDRAAAEMFDLLAPGGWLVVQEYSVAGDRRARRVWDVVSHLVIIPLGVLVDRNPGLYRYLWRSVVDFETVTELSGRLAKAGFTDIAHRTASGWQRGILHTIVARKPRQAAETRGEARDHNGEAGPQPADRARAKRARSSVIARA